MNNEIFWLTVANVSLGTVMVACIVLFVKVPFRDIMHRTHKRESTATGEDGDKKLDGERTLEKIGGTHR